MARTGTAPALVHDGIKPFREYIMSEQERENVAVAVVTTSGRWPTEGFETVPASEKVQKVLDQATHELKIVGTSGWIATVGATTLVADATLASNGFKTGTVVVDFGPRQGGGGYA
jgi:hypothetical protein